MLTAWLKRKSLPGVEAAAPNQITASSSIREATTESVLREGRLSDDTVSTTVRPKAKSEAVRESTLSSFELRLPTATEVADQHAKWLAQWITKDLGTAVGTDRVLLSDELQVSYGEMCREMKIPPRPWNAVAAKFAVLIRQPDRPRKTYTDRINKVGRKQRLRCYIIPSPS